MCKGYGHTGRMDKLARDERRARKEAERQARARAKELRNAEKVAAALAAQAEAEAAALAEEQRLEDEWLHSQGLKTPAEIEQERQVRALFKAVDKDGSGSVRVANCCLRLAACCLVPACCCLRQWLAARCQLFACCSLLLAPCCLLLSKCHLVPRSFLPDKLLPLSGHSRGAPLRHGNLRVRSTQSVVR